MAPLGHHGVEVVAWTDPAPTSPRRRRLEVLRLVTCRRGCWRAWLPRHPPPCVDRPPEYLSATLRRTQPPPALAADAGRRRVADAHVSGSWLHAAHRRTAAQTRSARSAARVSGTTGWRNGTASRPIRERLVSLFCYRNPALPALLECLAGQPTLCSRDARTGHRAGWPPRSVRTCAGRALRVQFPPWLSQDDYDALLWAMRPQRRARRGTRSSARNGPGGRSSGRSTRKPTGRIGPSCSPSWTACWPAQDQRSRNDVRALWLGWNGFAALPPVLPIRRPGRP